MAISISMVVMVIYRFGRVLCPALEQGINASGISEFLVKFSGGFVRRGLLGECLYKLSEATGISPYPVILTLSLIFLTFVVAFFLKSFRRRDMNWWIVLSPLFCGLVVFFIRKDFMQYTLLIGTLLLMRQWGSRWWNVLAVCILGVFGLFLHEAYLFWGIPLSVAVLYGYTRRPAVAVASSLLFIGCFALMCVYKGDSSNVEAILDSWHRLLGDEYHKSGLSIVALGWNAVHTFWVHFNLNFHVSLFEVNVGWMGAVIQLLFFMATYYFILNFSWTFRRPTSDFTAADRTNLSAIYLLCALTLLPMFTILSCDYSRLYQYLFVASYAAVLILPRGVCTAMLPGKYLIYVGRMNASIDRCLLSSKGLMVLLLLLLAVAPYSLNLYLAFEYSVVGTISEIFMRALRWLVHLV